MKRLIGVAVVILVTLFLSNNVFAKGFPFELDGKKYEAAPQDLYGYYEWAGAKAACEALVDPDDFNSDWFLPSKDELNAMYEQLHKSGVGGFANVIYWSSTEDDGDFAWGQSFVSGVQLDGYKGNYGRVRCVRAL